MEANGGSVIVGFDVDRILDVVDSFVVVLTGVNVVSMVVDIGKLVVVVATAGLEVTTVASLLFVVEGRDLLA